MCGRQLSGPMPAMLWAAAVIEGAIGNFADMGILLGIQVEPPSHHHHHQQQQQQQQHYAAYACATGIEGPERGSDGRAGAVK